MRQVQAGRRPHVRDLSLTPQGNPDCCNAWGREHALPRLSADGVRKDFGRTALATLAEALAAMDQTEWSLVYEGFDPSAEGVREALCTLGNGYFATRGAAPWARADGVRYPGVYLAGGYDRLRTRIGDREVETEDLVNLPNWLSLEFDLAGSGWFDERQVAEVGLFPDFVVD